MIYFEGFTYPACDLKKFAAACDIFTILLKNGRIIHHVPHDTCRFRRWLESHRIEDLKSGYGDMQMNRQAVMQ